MTIKKKTQNQELNKKIDPLTVIVEEHLLNGNESYSHSITERIQLTDKIVKEYLSYIRKLGIYVPVEFQKPVVEELGVRINEMVSKKIYGCMTIEEFQSKISKKKKEEAKNHYSLLQKIDIKKFGK